jgi:type VI secretion system secreted protein VgrG
MDTFDTLPATVLDMQRTRLMQISLPLSGGLSNGLLVHSMTGTEAISKGFEFRITVLSTDAHLPLKGMIGQPIVIDILQDDDTRRYLNGYIMQCRHTGADGGFAFYELVMRPWLSFLDYRRDTYIFQNMSVVDIVEEIFSDYKELANFEWRLERNYPQFTYRTQYQESDFNFVSRQLEEWGLHYFFEHHADGHKLVISDSSYHSKPLPDHDTLRYHRENQTEKHDTVTRFSEARLLQPASVAFSSFDFKQPSSQLQGTTQTLLQQGVAPLLEVYEYTGAYAFKNAETGDDYAKLRIEEFEARAKHWEGQSNCRSMVTGAYFELLDHYEYQEAEKTDRQFVVLELRHEAKNNYLPIKEKGRESADDSIAVYSNEFVVARRTVPYRPGRGFNSERPSVPGPQTATVVGPAGEEIYCDEHGRVKVQFHWDRAGTRDEKSSCWMRISNPWAGSGFGGIQLPRIGQEVIVDFLNGDPDQPVITGRFYNADNMAPWGLPANKTQSGFYSRSVGGGYNNANAIRFEDKSGQEQLWLHAEKDQLTEVENDEDKWVGNDRRKTIDGHETTIVHKNRTETVDLDETITIHKNRKEQVDLSETISIGTNRTESVALNELINIGVNRTEQVGKNEGITIGSNRTKTVMGNEKDKVGKNWSVKVGKNKTETIGVMSMQNVGMMRMENVGMMYNLNVGGMMMTNVIANRTDNVGAKHSHTVGKNFDLTVGTGTTSAPPDGAVTNVQEKKAEEKEKEKNPGSMIQMDGESIVLKVGKSIMKLDKEGNIFMTGNNINITALATDVTINGTKVWINPKGGKPGIEPDKPKSDSGGGGGGAPAGGADGGGFMSGIGDKLSGLSGLADKMGGLMSIAQKGMQAVQMLAPLLKKGGGGDGGGPGPAPAASSSLSPSSGGGGGSSPSSASPGDKALRKPLPVDAAKPLAKPAIASAVPDAVVDSVTDIAGAVDTIENAATLKVDDAITDTIKDAGENIIASEMAEKIPEGVSNALENPQDLAAPFIETAITHKVIDEVVRKPVGMGGLGDAGGLQLGKGKLGTPE